MREFHDLTAGAPLSRYTVFLGDRSLWQTTSSPAASGAGLTPVAFIDWDIAAPGKRIHDVAHVCWQYLDLGPSVAEPADAGLRMRLICDAYGLCDRSGLVEAILWWQDRCWRGIEAKAAAGDPAMIRLRDAGAARAVRGAFNWVTSHRAELAAPLS